MKFYWTIVGFSYTLAVHLSVLFSLRTSIGIYRFLALDTFTFYFSCVRKQNLIFKFIKTLIIEFNAKFNKNSYRSIHRSTHVNIPTIFFIILIFCQLFSVLQWTVELHSVLKYIHESDKVFDKDIQFKTFWLWSIQTGWEVLL